MGGGGAISGMQMSLKMNDRRKKREHFKKEAPPFKHEKATYNVPTVSEYRRQEIVSQIIRKRKNIERIGYLFLIVSVIAVILYLVL